MKSPRKPVTPVRSDAAPDWDAIEREYLAGQLSVREISRIHGGSPSGILKRAKARGWTRALREQVAVATDRKLLEADAGIKPGEKVPDREIVAAAALRAADVILSHRKHIVGLRDRLDAVAAVYDQRVRSLETDRFVTDWTEFASMGEALETIVGLTTKIFGLERLAFSLDVKSGAAGPDENKTTLSPDQRAAVLRNLRARTLGPEHNAETPPS